MRNPRPAAPDDPVRFEFERSLGQTVLFNGDIEGEPKPEDIQAAIDAFFRLDASVQRHILNGWHPESIKSDREAKRRNEESVPLFPVLRMRSCERRRSPYERQYCQFDEIADDDRATATLYIAAGSTKADVLRAMNWLLIQIDHHWDAIIIDPLKRQGKELPIAK